MNTPRPQRIDNTEALAPWATGKTFAGQDQLPKLPIPPLEETMSKYVKALEALQ
ncbi:hypothetical protein JCM3765_004161, partial [Sporobolomyces pararoseus]